MQQLKEIKAILEQYANTTLGELQPDGRYRFKTHTDNIFGLECDTYYDPRPAKKGLEIIKEILDNEI